MRKFERNAVIVLGMQGSGTSMAARVLNLVGCALPKSAVESTMHNRENGAWRSSLIAELNSGILTSAGSAWDDWRSFHEAWYQSPVVGRYKERAQNILQEEFGDSPLFVMEDPQLCRLLPFWVDAVRGQGAEPHVVSLIRNPWDVSYCLGMRNKGLDYSVVHLIWLRHVLDSETHSRTLRRVFTTYETLESNPREFVNRTSKELGISWPKPLDEQFAIEESMSLSSRYYSEHQKNAFLNERLPDRVRMAYEIFDRWVGGDAMENDATTLDEIRSAFDDAASMFSRPMASGDNRVKKVEKAMVERNHHARQLEEVVDERGHRIEQLEEAVDEQNRRIEQLESSVGERDRYISARKESQNMMSKIYGQQLDPPELSKYVFRSIRTVPISSPVRAIAFYLPQFHPIPENNKWWGRGFTEWANVARARPNFIGHDQPRLPSDMGFYDLRIEEIMEQQAEMARQYGIYGFCYHYYWFGGNRLLEMPIERMLETGRPSIPFCLSWANEDWTRTWDGRSTDVLISQQHSEQDDLAVIQDLARYMMHPNYIRVNEKPLLLVYRVELFPNISQTVSRWREFCLQNGIGEIYLALVGSFKHALHDYDPKLYGMDAVVEYPPHHADTPIDPPGEIVNPHFEGDIYSYPQIVKMYMEKEMPKGVIKIRGIVPSWDNTARRQNKGRVYYGSTPELYKKWLKHIMHQTHERYVGDERMIFINAWNEWAEGAHLEPDHRYGYAYLDATRSAIEEMASEIKGGPTTVRVVHIPNTSTGRR